MHLCNQIKEKAEFDNSNTAIDSGTMPLTNF